MWTYLSVRAAGIGSPSGSWLSRVPSPSSSRGVPGLTFTTSTWRTLSGRRFAVASSKILPRSSGSSRSVAIARPFSSTDLHDPARGRARDPGRRLLARVEAGGVGKDHVDEIRLRRERHPDLLLDQRVADEDQGGDDEEEEDRPGERDPPGLERGVDELLEADDEPLRKRREAREPLAHEQPPAAWNSRAASRFTWAMASHWTLAVSGDSAPNGSGMPPSASASRSPVTAVGSK